jgi:hypothetical protein
MICGVRVDPKSLGSLLKREQLAPVGPTDLLPVIARVKAPVLPLEAVWLRLEEWHRNDIKDTRVRTILILSLALGDFAVWAVTDGT